MQTSDAAGAPARQLMHILKRGAVSTIYAGAVPAMFSTRTQLGAEEKGGRQGRKLSSSHAGPCAPRRRCAHEPLCVLFLCQLKDLLYLALPRELCYALVFPS